MTINNLLPQFLRASTDPKDYAKSFAYYLDRKTMIARELREILLNVFRTGALYESTGGIDEAILPRDYWYTPIRCVLSSGSRSNECEAVYLHAVEVAKAINGLIDTDEDILYNCPVSIDTTQYSAPLEKILKDISSTAYERAVLKVGTGPITVNLPFPCFIGSGAHSVSSLTVDESTDVSQIVTKDSDYNRLYHIDAFETLSSLTSDCNKSVAISYILNELGNGNSSVSLSDIATSIESAIGVNGSRLLSDVQGIASIATDTNVNVEDRIYSIVSSVLQADSSGNIVEEPDDMVDSTELLTVISSSSFSGTDMKSVWNMANCSGVFETAFAIVGAVVKTVGKLVLTALKGLYSIGSRLWKKFVEPAYISKDFVKAEGTTHEKYCDVPFMYFGSVDNDGAQIPFNSTAMANLVKYKLGSQSYRLFDVSSDHLHIQASLDSQTAVGQPRHFTCELANPLLRDLKKSGSSTVKLYTRRLLVDDQGRWFSNPSDLSKAYSAYTTHSNYGVMIKDPSGNVVYADRKNYSKPGSGGTRSAIITYTDSLSATYNISSAASVVSSHGGEGVFMQKVLIGDQVRTRIFLHNQRPGSNSGWATSAQACLEVPGAVSGYGLDIPMDDEYHQIDGWTFSTPKLQHSGESVQIGIGGFEMPVNHWRSISYADRGTINREDPTLGAQTTQFTAYIDTDDGVRVQFAWYYSRTVIRIRIFHVYLKCADEWKMVYSSNNGWMGGNLGENNDLDWYEDSPYTSAVERKVKDIDGSYLNMTRKCNAYASTVSDAILTPNFEITSPIDIGYVLPGDRGSLHLHNKAGDEVFTLTRDNVKQQFVVNGEHPLGIRSDEKSYFTAYTEPGIPITDYSLDLDFNCIFRDPDDAVFLTDITATGSTILTLHASNNYMHDGNVDALSMALTFEEEERFYYDDESIPEYKWDSASMKLEWWSVPITELNDDEIAALLRDVRNPVDVGCACVSRYMFCNVQILSSEEHGLAGVIYGCPINHSYLFKSDGSFRFYKSDTSLCYIEDDGTVTVHSEENAAAGFISILTRCYNDTNNGYDDGEDGDVRGYHDMYASKVLTDMYMYMISNQKEEFLSLFDESPSYTPKILNLSDWAPGDYNNKAFYQLLLGAGVVSPSLVSDWMYSYMFAILANKESFMRVYYKLFGKSPDFFPYLIGDRLGSPLWHISTDNDIQSYVDRLCAAIVIAVAVIAAVVIIGVAAAKIRKAFKAKLNDRVANEMSIKQSYSAQHSSLNGHQADRDNLKAQLRNATPGTDEYNRLLDDLKSNAENIASCKAAMKATSKSLLKAQKSTKRWEKFASAFGTKLDIQDQVRSAFADYSISEASVDTSDDDVDEMQPNQGLTLPELSSALSQTEEDLIAAMPSLEGLDLDLAPVLSAISNAILSINTASRNGPLDM